MGAEVKAALDFVLAAILLLWAAHRIVDAWDSSKGTVGK